MRGLCVLVATRVDEFRRQKAVLADGATGVIVFSAVNSSDDVYVGHYTFV